MAVQGDFKVNDTAKTTYKKKASEQLLLVMLH